MAQAMAAQAQAQKDKEERERRQVIDRRTKQRDDDRRGGSAAQIRVRPALLNDLVNYACIKIALIEIIPNESIYVGYF